MTALPLCFIAVCVLYPAARLSADTVSLVDGGHKEGRVWGITQDALVLSIQPVPGLPEVEVKIPKTHIAGIAFSPDEHRDLFLQNATTRQLPEVAELWERFGPLLPVNGSPAARIGLRYGLLLLAAGVEERRTDPLSIFQKIAATTPHKSEQEAAKQGVLRTLLQRRQWERAESEAASITKSTCGVALLAEARLTLGLVSKNKLGAFIAENPRWSTDEFARPQRDRLYQSALDNLLGAALLPGAPAELTVRALYCALEIHSAEGERHRAATLARDIIAFHPESPEAMLARDWLRTQPTEADSKPR